MMSFTFTYLGHKFEIYPHHTAEDDVQLVSYWTVKYGIVWNESGSVHWHESQKKFYSRQDAERYVKTLLRGAQRNVEND